MITRPDDHLSHINLLTRDRQTDRFNCWQ